MPFQSGVSGNPNGRPVGSVSVDKPFATMLKLAIADAHAQGGNKLRAVAEALVDKAMTGDVPAIKEIAERLDGKVPQAQDIDLTSSDGSMRMPTRIELVPLRALPAPSED